MFLLMVHHPLGESVNFDLSEDEELLKALAERFVLDRYDLERRRQYRASDTGFSAENWSLLGDLGLIGAPFAVEDGGAALDATAIGLVFEALGAGLTVEPLIENILVAGRLFARTARGELRNEWLPSLVAGSRRIALAHVEYGRRGWRAEVITKAEGHGTGVWLTGTKQCVPAGGAADGYIVTANGATGSQSQLYFVAATEPGLSVRSWRMADGGSAVSLFLEGVAACPLDGGWVDVVAVEALASLARSAEALGIMRRMFDETLGYLQTRKQFGVPLGSFQALQHRMAAQYAVVEQARALIDLAVVSDGTPQFATAVDGARAFIAETSLTLGHEMIQFHGGMGVSDELTIGHGHKRLLVLSRWPEDPGATLDRFAGVVPTTCAA